MIGALFKHGFGKKGSFQQKACLSIVRDILISLACFRRHGFGLCLKVSALHRILSVRIWSSRDGTVPLTSSFPASNLPRGSNFPHMYMHKVPHTIPMVAFWTFW